MPRTRENNDFWGVSPESRYFHKSHNVSILLFHIVYSTKYRREVLSPKVVRILLKTCKGIEERYEIEFLEIGSAQDHIHFLVQSVPMYSVTKIVRIIKSITAREIFKQAPGVKRALWGGEFWSDGYYVNTVSKFGSEHVISSYVKNQGKAVYERIYENNQLGLF